MKDKLFYKLFFTLFLIILFFLPRQPILAYSTFTTHPGLTEQIIDFYNYSNAQNPITPQQKEWIIKGSIDEDTAPRWINHFYDPIYKQGWTGELAGRIPAKIMLRLATAGFFTPQPATAIQWINNQKLQKKYAYYGGDHTWKKALEDYADGNYEEAFISLGHVLHVLEDMSVPDHTRNDTHVHEIWPLTSDYGSPYEEYLKKYNRGTIKKLDFIKNIKESKAQPLKFNSIDDYLTSLANYSNKYFFSKDTIAINKYSLPRIAFDDGQYAYGFDENGKKIPLAAVRRDKNKKKEFYFPYPSDKFDAKKEAVIVRAYFQRLAKQAMLHAAGAMNLFFQQARQEKIQREYSFFFNGSGRSSEHIDLCARWRPHFFKSGRSPFISVKEHPDPPQGARNCPLGWGSFNFKIPFLDSILNPPAVSLIGETLRAQSIGQSLIADVDANSNINMPSDAGMLINENETPQSIISAPLDKNLQTDIASSTDIASLPAPIIPFIATSIKASSTINNISTSSIEISTTTMAIPAPINIPLNIPLTNPQLTPTTSIIYSYSFVSAAPPLPAPITMSAQTPPITMSAQISNPSSSSITVPAPIQTFIPTSTSTSTSTPIPTSTTSTLIINPSSTAPFLNPSSNKILISQIKTGEYNNANNQFIEFYNPNDQDIALANWSLQRKISQNAATTTNLIANFPTSSIIAAKSFFLIASNDYAGSATPDLRYDNNANSLGYDDNWIILRNSSGAISNAVYYTQILPTQSWWRKANVSSTLASMAGGADQFNGNGYELTDDINDFIVRPTAVPKNSANLAAPRRLPTAPNLTINFSSSSMNLNLQWSESLDYKDSTSSIAKYIIKEINSTSIISDAFTTTSTKISFPIAEDDFNKTFSFSAQAVDQEGLAGEASQKDIILPNLTSYIIKQADYSAAEGANNGNGIFYQYFGNNLIGSPKDLTFHAKFDSGSPHYISVEFFEAAKTDYSDARSISFNACYIQNNEGAYRNIPDGNCPNLSFSNGIEKDYTIPIQQPFTFNPIKYYKMKIFMYQSFGMEIYGSTSSVAYIYGKAAAAPLGNSLAEIPMGLQSLYFLIHSQSLINLPIVIDISQMTPMNFQADYSTSALKLNLNWLPPRYINGMNLTYKILDISPAAFYTTSSNQSSGPKVILPLISTTATSTIIPISEVGRKYKFRLWAEDSNANQSFAVESPDIFAPYSFNDNFIIAQQTNGSVFEAPGYFAHTFYQTLSNGQRTTSSQIGAISIKASSPGKFIKISASEINGTSTINTADIAYCIYAASAVNEGYQNGPICSDYYLGNNVYVVPAMNNFIFDPIKQYKLSITVVDPYSSPVIFGSPDLNAYPNGIASKLYNDGTTAPHEIPTNTVKNFYFVILSSTPLR